MRISFRQLTYFLKVVDLGSFTRAAESLNIAQPALSQQICKLEHALGTQLLLRSHKGAEPSESGRILYRSGQQILHQLDVVRAEISARSVDPTGHVAVGMPGSVSLLATVPILTAMRRQLPNVVLEIREADNDVLSEMLLNGRVDIALLSDHGTLGGIREEPLLRERLFLVHRNDPPFEVSGDEPVSLQEMARIPLILPGSNAPKRQMMEALFRASDLALNLAAETSAISTTISAVNAGIGAAILPWSATAHSLAQGLLRRRAIEQPRFSRPISLCSSERAPPSTASLAVAAVIKRVICEMVIDGDWQEVDLLASHPPDRRTR